MERASCDLLTYLEKNKVENESEVLRMILQVVAGVEHLHSKYIYHRDLKLDNIFVFPNLVLKVGDLG